MTCTNSHIYQIYSGTYLPQVNPWSTLTLSALSNTVWQCMQTHCLWCQSEPVSARELGLTNAQVEYEDTHKRQKCTKFQWTGAKQWYWTASMSIRFWSTHSQYVSTLHSFPIFIGDISYTSSCWISFWPVLRVWNYAVCLEITKAHSSWQSGKSALRLMDVFGTDEAISTCKLSHCELLDQD